MNEDRPNVAIACQGGGSHTAFTAGVLKVLLRELDWGREYELVGVSGASGGSFNALAVWYGFVTEDVDRGIELLDSLWTDLAADEPMDRAVNDWLVRFSRIESSGAPVPSVSPYQVPGSSWGQEEIKRVLERHIDFEKIPGLCQRDSPELVVGTVNVNAGEFETFVNEEVTPEAVLASAAVPNIFKAVEIHGHLHWDGLFSQNPPVRDLMKVEMERRPDELWVIQVNPQEFEGEPKMLDVIADRRNELSGNISLNQELRFIELVNDWIEEGKVSADDFARTRVRRIQIGERYHCSTKLNRTPSFIEELIELGEERGKEFVS